MWNLKLRVYKYYIQLFQKKIFKKKQWSSLLRFYKENIIFMWRSAEIFLKAWRKNSGKRLWTGESIIC